MGRAQRPLDPMVKKRNEIGLIVGKKGSGKSTLGRNIFKSNKRTVAVDTEHDFEAGVVIQDPGQLPAWWNKVYGLADFKMVYRPMDDLAVDQFFHFWNRPQVGQATLVIDEVDKWSNPHQTAPGLAKLLNYGRHRAINLVGIARRPANVSKTWTANADWIAAFQTTDLIDLDYLSKWMDASNNLRDLDQFKFTVAAPGPDTLLQGAVSHA